VTIQLVANGTIGACMPTALKASLDLQAELNAQIAVELAAIANLNVRLSVALELSITPPALMLQGSLDLLAGVNAQLAADITMPTFSANLTGIVADIQAELGLRASALAALQAKLAAALTLSLSLGSAGVRLYAYEGPLSSMGDEIASFTAGTPGDGGMQQSADVAAVMLVTDIPATSAALRVVFGA
jgi:hypothetical protein